MPSSTREIILETLGIPDPQHISTEFLACVLCALYQEYAKRYKELQYRIDSLEK